MEVSAAQSDAIWKDAFPGVERPQLYTRDAEDEHGFRPINDAESFSEDTTMMTTQQLYAISSNNQLALKQAQDEYLEIESVIRRLSGKDSKKNPQAPQSNTEFEGRREATLYGYKYHESNPVIRTNNLEEVTEVEKRDVTYYQEPFAQGGFIPTPKQYATKIAKAADKRNPDGWKPIEKDGRMLIPKLQQKHEEYVRHAPWTQEDIDAARAGSTDPEQRLTNGTPVKPVDKRLTRTRYDGSKVPITRDVSEDPFRAPSPRHSRAQTPKGLGIMHMTPGAGDGSPVPRKRQRFDNVNTSLTQSAGNTPAPTQPRPRVRAGQASVPTGPLSPRSMRNWKWTNEGLLSAIQNDYSWLHPDPVKALLNKDKLLTAANPVRTWSMCNKWIEWHEKGLDKRPRNKDGHTKGIDQGAVPKLGLALAVVESIEPQEQGNTPRPISRGSLASNGVGKGSRENGVSASRKNSNAGSRQNSNAGSRKNSIAGYEAVTDEFQKGIGKGSRKNSAAKIDGVEEELLKMIGRGSRKNSAAEVEAEKVGSSEGSVKGSRENSAASHNLTKEPIQRTPSAASNKRPGSAASVKAPSSTRSTRRMKRKYKVDNEDEDDDEETLQSQADRQLLHDTIEKEDKDGEFRVRTPRKETVSNTPTRRSLRSKSQAGGR